MADPPIIRRRCHKGGHHASACPEASTGNRSEQVGRRPPPSKCWTCELIDGADANHRGDECPVAAQRRIANAPCVVRQTTRRKGVPDTRQTNIKPAIPRPPTGPPVPSDQQSHGACAAGSKGNTPQWTAQPPVPQSSCLTPPMPMICSLPLVFH